ncbi:MAG: MFS transporter [Chloroflexi bacterium]|nr:MFS transporter [Chloroflexota bacterium]
MDQPQQNTPAQPEHSPAALPFWRTVLYGFGNAAGQLTYSTFNTFIQYFYTDVQGLPPQWVGRGWFAFGFWNAINDPIAGSISDRTHTRWGRRKFYIGLLAIPVAIAFALIWLPPFDKSNPTALMVYFLAIISLYDLLQSIVTLNQDALFPEMYQGTAERATGASTRQLIGFVLGNGVAVSLTPTIYGHFGWTALALLWGSLTAIMYLVSLIGIQENPAFSDQPSPSWREQMQVVFTNRTFMIVLGINFIVRFILAVITAALPFYAETVLRAKEAQLSTLLAAMFATSGLSVILWQFIIRQRGTRLSMLASMLIAALFTVPLLITHSLIATGVVLTMIGFAIGGSILGPDLLFAEVVDEDYVKTGQRREGTYRGILGFIYRFPPALAGLMLGEGLAMAGYDSDLTTQPEAVVNIIRAFSSLLPIIGLIVGIVLLVKYPLHGDYLRDIQQRAAEMKATAEKERLNP